MPGHPLKRRLALNAVLLGAAAALGALLWLDPGGREPPVRLLDNLEKEQVTAIRIERRGGETVSLEKHDGGWRMLAPFPAEADDFRVANILNILSIASRARYPAAGLDPAEFGLAPPLATLYLNKRPLEFGDTDPVEGLRYVRAGQILHLTDDTVLPLLTGGPATLTKRDTDPNASNAQ